MHGCGHIEPINKTIPYESTQQPGTIFRARIRCANCADGGLLRVDDRADRLTALKIYCERCRQVVIDRLLARCPRCFPRFFREAQAGANLGQLAFRSAMRITRHSANNAYYAHSISILRLDRPRVAQASLEQAWLDSLLPERDRAGQLGAAQGLAELVERLREAEQRGDQQLVVELRSAIGRAAAAPGAPPPAAPRALATPLRSDVVQSVRECVALLSSVRRVTVAAQEGPFVNATPVGTPTLARLGIARIELVSDLPVVTGVFGYTRRSTDPTYTEEGAAEPFPPQMDRFESWTRKQRETWASAGRRNRAYSCSRGPTRRTGLLPQARRHDRVGAELRSATSGGNGARSADVTAGNAGARGSFLR